MTHPSHYPQRVALAVRGTVPRPAGRVTIRARPQPRPRPRARPSTPPRIRLTGLGCGVLATAAMAVTAWFSELIGGVPTLYGVLFLIISLAAAIWVRPADLICAPIAAPLAFAAGLVPTSGIMGTLTDLALRAPWLFAGTMAAAAVALLRQGLFMLGAILQRRRRQRQS